MAIEKHPGDSMKYISKWDYIGPETDLWVAFRPGMGVLIPGLEKWWGVQKIHVNATTVPVRYSKPSFTYTIPDDMPLGLHSMYAIITDADPSRNYMESFPYGAFGREHKLDDAVADNIYYVTKPPEVKPPPVKVKPPEVKPVVKFVERGGEWI